MNFKSFRSALIREGWGDEALNFPDWTDVDGTLYEAASYNIHSAGDTDHFKWGTHIFERMALASYECDEDQEMQRRTLTRAFIAYCLEMVSVGMEPRQLVQINQALRSTLQKRGCWAGIQDKHWKYVPKVWAFLEKEALMAEAWQGLPSIPASERARL